MSERGNVSEDQSFTAFPSYERWCVFRVGMHTERSEYEAQKQLAADHATHVACAECKEGFSDSNVRTMEGWQETQISGLCENCFDELTQEPEEDDGWAVEDGHDPDLDERGICRVCGKYEPE